LFPTIKKEECMRPLQSLVIGLAVWWPALAFAEGAGGGYRGIGSIYYTFIWAVLCYGLYDTFGKTVMYIGAPILAIAAYLALPPG
jgi:hypothetical protein